MRPHQNQNWPRPAVPGTPIQYTPAQSPGQAAPNQAVRQVINIDTGPEGQHVRIFAPDAHHGAVPRPREGVERFLRLALPQSHPQTQPQPQPIPMPNWPVAPVSSQAPFAHFSPRQVQSMHAASDLARSVPVDPHDPTQWSAQHGQASNVDPTASWFEGYAALTGSEQAETSQSAVPHARQEQGSVPVESLLNSTRRDAPIGHEHAWSTTSVTNEPDAQGSSAELDRSPGDGTAERAADHHGNATLRALQQFVHDRQKRPSLVKTVGKTFGSAPAHIIGPMKRTMAGNEHYARLEAREASSETPGSPGAGSKRQRATRGGAEEKRPTKLQRTHTGAEDRAVSTAQGEAQIFRTPGSQVRRQRPPVGEGRFHAPRNQPVSSVASGGHAAPQLGPIELQRMLEDFDRQLDELRGAPSQNPTNADSINSETNTGPSRQDG